MSGIILDQHYSDSLIRLLAPLSYTQMRVPFQRAKPVPKRDLLSSLLLFGKAFVIAPPWLNAEIRDELRAYEDKELLEWIPEQHYLRSFSQIGSFLKKEEELIDLVIMREGDMVAFDSRGNLRVKEFRQRQRNLSLNISEAASDITFRMGQLFYLSPVLEAHLSHLGFRDIEPEKTITHSIERTYSELVPAELFAHPDLSDAWDGFAVYREGSFYSYLDSMWEDLVGNAETYRNHYGSSFEPPSKRDRRIFRQVGGLLDCTLTSLTLESFAADTDLPIKTAGIRGFERSSQMLVSDEAYQLVKFQFKKLRYPVIESIEDVLRLREDPHLVAYRNVITEYSQRLRSELEEGKPRVLRSFHHDLKLALGGLSAIRKWETTVDVSFWISLPLALAGVVSGLPLSELVAIPLTLYAKYVTRKKRKELDWIMFGRPQL